LLCGCLFDHSDKLIKHNFKITLLPLVDTTNWYGVGKFLNNILGYAGLGDSVEVYTGDENNFYKIGNIINAMNYALDFTFNRIDIDFLNFYMELFYNRGNYDASAKNDIYGLAFQGSFSDFPIGFSIEGGYKRFYSVVDNFKSAYPNTGYFNIDLSYAFKNIKLGLNYYYDKIHQSFFTLTISSDFLSGRLGFGLSAAQDRIIGERLVSAYSFNNSYGVRYRHGAWR
jgi:hypothetical protein